MVGLWKKEAATMGKGKRQVSPKVKFQVVLETLTEDKTLGQIARAYGVHPISVGLWKMTFLERARRSLPETVPGGL
jgi:transposase-like protein